MRNLEAIWTALDELAAEVIPVDRAVGMQMLTRNRELMLAYQQLAAQMTQLSAHPASNGKPKETAKQP